jgi:hypothetical protein
MRNSARSRAESFWRWAVALSISRSSITDLNAALASLVYLGASGFVGGDTLSLTASDGSVSTSASVTINVTPTAT